MDQPNQRSNLVRTTSGGPASGAWQLPSAPPLPFTSLLGRRVRWAARQLRRGPAAARATKAAPAGAAKPG